MYKILLILFLFTSNVFAGDIVISQLNGGGGATGAYWKNDYVELYNKGTVATNLSGWSVQFAFSANTTWVVVNLSGSLKPGAYYLVQFGSSGAVGSTLPTADATDGAATNLNPSLGKIALLNTTTALTVLCPSSPSGTVIDFIGYGAAVSCSETSPIDGLLNAVGAYRKYGGCTDTENNSLDFFVYFSDLPGPRNTSSALNICSGG